MIRIGSMRSGARKCPGQPCRVDRATALGNPFFMATEADRDRVCEKYEEWFKNSVLPARQYAHLRPNDLLSRAWEYLQELLRAAKQGDVALMCWCAPRRCHAETIRAWLERELEKQEKEAGR